jgi:DNA-binding Lrp family transcriptional regulator
MNVDAKDIEILDILRQDCRIPNAQLANQVGLSASSCWRRVRALEDSGVVRNYTVSLDNEKMGMNFTAVVQVHLSRHDEMQVRAFQREVQARSEIRECHATTGQADYHLIVECADIAAYNRFLEEVLFRLPAVDSVQSNVVLRTLKQG